MNTIIKLLLPLFLIIIIIFCGSARQRTENHRGQIRAVLQSRKYQSGDVGQKNGDYEGARIGFSKENNNQVFNIGSATKTFTAVLILQEMEKGNLKLSDTLGKFLNPIKNIPGNVTIKQLLKHESGLGRTVGNPDVDGYGAYNDDLFRGSFYDGIAPQDTTKVGTYK